MIWECLFDFILPGIKKPKRANTVAEFLQELAVADDAHAESSAASHLYSIDENEVILSSQRLYSWPREEGQIY